MNEHVSRVFDHYRGGSPMTCSYNHFRKELSMSNSHVSFVNEVVTRFNNLRISVILRIFFGYTMNRATDVEYWRIYNQKGLVVCLYSIEANTFSWYNKPGDITKMGERACKDFLINTFIDMHEQAYL